MFLSFVVPIYNVKDYLRECIDSLLNQNVNDYEIILVDDGSTDGSGVICDEYEAESEKIRVIHQTNKGLSEARNIGIQNTSGNYIAFVDGDDYIEPNCLGKLFDAVKSQNEPDVVFMRAYKYLSNGKLSLLDEDYNQEKIVNRERTEVLEYIAGRKKYPGSACTKIIKKQLIIKNEMYFEKGRLSEDLDWVKKILFIANSFGYYCGLYYYYRQNREGSITNSVSYRSYRDRMVLYDTWIEELNTTRSETEKRTLESFLAYEYQIMIMDYSKLTDSEKKEAYQWLQANRDLLEYGKDTKSKLMKGLVAVAGLSGASEILKRVYAIKNR